MNVQTNFCESCQYFFDISSTKSNNCPICQKELLEKDLPIGVSFEEKKQKLHLARNSYVEFVDLREKEEEKNWRENYSDKYKKGEISQHSFKKYYNEYANAINYAEYFPIATPILLVFGVIFFYMSIEAGVTSGLIYQIIIALTLFPGLVFSFIFVFIFLRFQILKRRLKRTV
ncbi:MAG: hypothetical protein HeimC3_03080 [Candidatus Heimdallarchaeota archaeon LC_3]|nr:MAG: hypothetical protein HeimC3_03080 [Candidatus Heimdallarchaeota archaeon LC_3]